MFVGEGTMKALREIAGRDILTCYRLGMQDSPEYLDAIRRYAENLPEEYRDSSHLDEVFGQLPPRVK